MNWDKPIEMCLREGAERMRSEQRPTLRWFMTQRQTDDALRLGWISQEDIGVMVIITTPPPCKKGRAK